MPDQSKTQTEVTQRRGEMREGRRGTAYTDALLGRAEVEMGRDSSARGDTEGTLAPAHTMRTVKASQPQRWTFILVLCSLLFISRMLPFVRLKLHEDSRVPALLLPLPVTGQQEPESLNTSMNSLPARGEA